jgi:hypothetical protein
VDAISAVTFDLGMTGSATLAVTGGQASTFDIAHFENLYQRKEIAPQDGTATVSAVDTGGGFQAAVKALESLNANMADMSKEAMAMAADIQELTPGAMLQMTMHAHHFVFQSQLTANVANRTSEGIQQLFRQQS